MTKIRPAPVGSMICLANPAGEYATTTMSTLVARACLSHMEINQEKDGVVTLRNSDESQLWFKLVEDNRIELCDIAPAKGGGGFEFLLVPQKGWGKGILYVAPYSDDVRSWVMTVRDAISAVCGRDIAIVHSSDC